MAPDWAPHVARQLSLVVIPREDSDQMRTPYGVIVRHRGVNSEDVSFAGGKDPMFVHVSQRSGTLRRRDRRHRPPGWIPLPTLHDALLRQAITRIAREPRTVASPKAR
jgi:hypothetical protein